MTEVPKSKNGISSIAFHQQRKKYIREAYSLLNEGNAIDMWYGNKAFYGRIDQRGIPQMISETNLKSFPSAPEVMAADFVVDAFQDFRQYLIKASRRGKIDLMSGFLGMITPKRGWESAREKYDSNIRIVYGSFVSDYLDEGNKHNKIKDFGTFMNQFIKFTFISSTVTPITLSGLVTSRNLSPTVSGLVVELSLVPHDNDQVKFRKFLKDPAFKLYQTAARKFGFRVDYNAPWRLVADISSKEMGKYMEDYGISSVSSLFEIYYYNTHRLDVSLVKKYLVQLYNDYARGNPIAKRVHPGPRHDPGVRSKLIRRSPATEASIDAQFDNFYWLNFYFQVRSAELGIEWSRASKEKKLQETRALLNLVDFPRALEYIVEEMFKNS